MVKKCCVPFCEERYKKGSGIKFQSFPKNNKRQNLWCIKLRLGDSIDINNSFVCSNHFLPSDYSKSITSGITDVLKSGAVPSHKIPRRPHDKQLNPDILRERTNRVQRRAATASAATASNVIEEEFAMAKEVDPSDIGRHPNLIKRAQKDMSECDVLVCGQCHSVFHFMELFAEHKTQPCNKDSSLKDSRETKPKVWAFMLWKSSQLRGEESQNVNFWKLFQIWAKLEEAIRETWVVAGRTIQSFAKIGQGNLQEMPVKITKTVVDTAVRSTGDLMNSTVDGKTPSKVPAKPTKLKVKSKTDNGNKPSAPKTIEIADALKGNSPESDKVKKSIESLNTSTDGKEVKGKMGSAPFVGLAKPTGVRAPLTKLPANPVLLKKSPSKLATRTIPNMDGKTEEVCVEKILAKRFNPRQRYHEYLVKWDKLETDKNTWEPQSHFSTSQKLVDTFELQLARQKEARALAIAQAEADAAAAVEKEKEMRKASSNQITGSEITSPQRLSRNSKLKALDQVKKWLTGTDVPQASEPKKRKNNDSDYEGHDDELSAEEETGETPPKKILKRESASSVITQAIKNAGISGTIPSYPVNKLATTKNIGSTKVSTEASSIVTDSITTGIVKRSGITINSTQKPQPAKTAFVQKAENGVAGVVRVNPTTMSTKAAVTISSRPLVPMKGALTSRPSGITLKSIASTSTTTKPVVITKKSAVTVGAQKPSGVAVSQVPRTSSAASSNLLGNTIITRVPKGTPNSSKPTTPIPENKLALLQRQSGLKITRKSPSGSLQAINVPSPQPSPPAELSLCPITGKVLGQEDNEEPFKTFTTALANDGNNFIGDSEAGVTIVTGEDGTVYQVAGKNAQGQTILIPQGSDGSQQCVYMSGDQPMTDLHAEAAANMLTLDPSAAETYTDAQMITDQIEDISVQPQIRMLTDLNTIDTSQPLAISTGDAESQEGQVTAEVVQADLPSPGGTRRVVLLLPDGSFMMTEVSDEQFQSLNLAT